MHKVHVLKGSVSVQGDRCEEELAGSIALGIAGVLRCAL